MVDKTRRNLEIVNLALQGKTLIEIGDHVNLSNQRVSQLLHDKEYKALLEQGHKRQILSLHHAIDRHDTLIDSEDEKIALGAVQLRYKTIGILPSHTQTTYIQQLNIQQNNVLSPELLSTLSQIMSTKHRLPPVDVKHISNDNNDLHDNDNG